MIVRLGLILFVLLLAIENLGCSGIVATNPSSNVAPSIAAQPLNQTVTAGQTASFSVAATGTAPLGYQWQKNGVVIPGATASSYTAPATTSSDSGAQFTATVSNSAGTVTSSAATLTVSATPVAPSITTQPTSQRATAGQSASFSVAATGTAPLRYQWEKNGVNIAGATTASYTTPATTTSDSGSTFRVVVHNTAGTVTSAAATLTVNAASGPGIQVSSTSINFGNVVVGTTLSQVLIITNTGTNTLSITQVTASGSAFTLSGFSLPLSVSAGQQTTITVAFLPTAVGAASGNISIVSNASTSPTSVGLSGSGIATTYTLGISPTSLAFGNINVGNTGSLSATLTNTGNSNVTISSVTTTGTGFTTTGLTSGTLLTPNQSTTLNVAFAPLAAGTVTGSVSVASNATNSPATVTLSGTGVAATATINVLNYGATGNGTTDDTAAINSAIAALTSGATLLFPCGTYLTTSQLSISASNVTIDGSSCAVIHGAASGGSIMVIGNGVFMGSYGPAVALSGTANELGTSFTTVSSLGVAAGDYIYISQGGKDYSTDTAPGNDTGCDVSGCRRELLKVASVSGNTITVTTALHDTYNPIVNAAVAQKLLNPVAGITLKNITLDGSGTENYGLLMLGVVDSTVTGVTAKNVVFTALYGNSDFNLAWNNVTVTGAGNHNGTAMNLWVQGNASVNGASVSNLNPGGVLAFGFEISGVANGTFSNITVDASGAYGRPFKTVATRWNTFNSLTVKNSPVDDNGFAIEYYTSHNTFNNCVVTNNGTAGTGTGNAGINLFGNFNQYNTFNNCTISGNGNVQFYVSGYDALRLAQDSHNTVSGGTFTGSNSVEAVFLIEGDGTFITGATISGPGAQGIYLDTQASNACVNNNTFTPGTGLSSAISANSTGDLGLLNILGTLGSNLAAGVCAPPLP